MISAHAQANMLLNVVLVERKVCCHVVNAFLSGWELVRPISRLKISKMSVKHVFDKKLLESSGRNHAHNFKSASCYTLIQLLAQLLPELYSTWSTYITKNTGKHTCPRATNPSTILSSNRFSWPGTARLALFQIWPSWSRGRLEAMRIGNNRLVSMASHASVVFSAISL